MGTFPFLKKNAEAQMFIDSIFMCLSEDEGTNGLILLKAPFSVQKMAGFEKKSQEHLQRRSCGAPDASVKFMLGFRVLFAATFASVFFQRLDVHPEGFAFETLVECNTFILVSSINI